MWRIALVVLVAAMMVMHVVSGDSWFNAPTYLAVMVGAPVAAALGTARAPEGERRIPLLITTGLAFNAVAESLWYAYDLRGLDPDASWADVFYLSSYVFLLWAVWLVILKAHRGRLGTDAALDVLTIVVVSVLVFVSLSVRDIVTDDTIRPLARFVLALYPLLDAVLLALVLRTLGSPRARQVLGPMFALGAVAWLVPDLAYILIDQTTLVTNVLDIGWMLGVALMAAAAWHTPDEESVPEPRERSMTGQLLIAVAPLMVPALIEVLSEATDRGDAGPELIVGTAVLLALAFWRTARLLRSEQEARRELAIARDAALEASRAKSSFLATVSHEIRTPMNGVIGLADLLSGTELDDRQRQYVDGVRTAGQALLSVINDVLDFSKVEAGRLELEEIDFSLVQVVEDAVELVADGARAKGLELISYCDAELPGGLRGDPTRLRQVLLNLASNAVKFTDAGEVVVRAREEHRDGDEITVRFEVSDTGIGIDDDDRGRLFQPFSQADSSTTRRFGGTGLGLAICFELVSAMGGEIGVHSELGRGSTFWFTLPFSVAPDVARTSERSPEALQGLRVLVVDDNATNRLILTEQLGSWGVRPTVVPDGSRALAVMAHERFDLAVVDLMMPQMDGLELARNIRADHPGTGLVLLTSGPDVSSVEANRAGVDVWLTKPVHAHLLRSALLEVVGHRAADPAPAPATVDPASRGLVLVVDDNDVNQMVAVGMLEHLGFTVDTRDDGAQALEAIEAGSYVAVLMDARMPGMDGLAATRALREREQDGRRRTPVIALTAGVTDGERAACLAAGMDDYVPKPVDPVALETALSRWVPRPTS